MQPCCWHNLIQVFISAITLTSVWLISVFRPNLKINCLSKKKEVRPDNSCCATPSDALVVPLNKVEGSSH